jgi:ribosomal subunit interface protein
MEKPLRITFLDVPPSPALEAHIRSKAEKLEQFHPHLVGCQVYVELDAKHRHQGRLFSVRLELKVPGDLLVVTRHAAEDVYVALRDAFDAARRQLESHARRLRGEVKTHEPEGSGHVARLFPDGYGFIEADDGRELYFHRENVVNTDFDRLEVGAPVRFLAEPAKEGWQAKRVSAR